MYTVQVHIIHALPKKHINVQQLPTESCLYGLSLRYCVELRASLALAMGKGLGTELHDWRGERSKKVEEKIQNTCHLVLLGCVLPSLGGKKGSRV